MSLELSTPLGTLGEHASIAVVFAAGYLLVTLAHEVTHFLAARLLRVPARLSIGAHLETEFVVDADRSVLVDRIIQLAPTLVGLAVGAAILAVGGVPATTLLNGVLVFLWLWFTLPSPDDLLGQRWEETDYSEWGPEQKVAITASLWVLAALVNATQPLLPYAYADVAWWCSQGIALAGVVHFIGLVVSADALEPDGHAIREDTTPATEAMRDD